MTNNTHNNDNSTFNESGDKSIIKALKEQLQLTEKLLEQERHYHRELKEKMIFQEKLNSQLSRFHLNSFFKERENKLSSSEENNELTKSQQHILLLGNMLLKNKHTISKLKKSKIKDDRMNKQLAELIQEKQFLWEVIYQVHEYFINTSNTSKEDNPKHIKVKNLIELTKNKYEEIHHSTLNKKLKP